MKTKVKDKQWIKLKACLAKFPSWGNSTIDLFLVTILERNHPSLFCQSIINKAACQEESLWNSAVAMFVTMSPSTSKFFVPWCIVSQNTKFLFQERYYSLPIISAVLC